MKCSDLFCCLSILLLLQATPGCKEGKQAIPGKIVENSQVEPEQEAGPSQFELDFRASQEALQAARSRSLIDPKQQCGALPIAWDLTNDGSALLGLVAKTNPVRNEVYRWKLNPPAASPSLLVKTTTGLRAFLQARPGSQMVLLSSLQPWTKNRLADDYWLGGDGSSELQRIDYLSKLKAPSAATANALEGRTTFFSRGGQRLLAPFGLSGLVVVDLASASTSYVELPSFGDIPVQHVQYGVLADQAGVEHIYASQFAVESGGVTNEAGILVPVSAEFCQLSFLNLDTLSWQEPRRFNWVVLEVACPDLAVAPWLLLGSRGKVNTSEHDRMARCASFDPRTGVELLLPYLEGLGWDGYGGMRLTLDAERLVYKDYEREAVIRIDVDSGERWADKANYLPDGGMLIDEQADTVLLVQQDVALRCELQPES